MWLKYRRSKVFMSRIQQWGLNKKLKEPEARAIIHLLARHRGRASCIRLRGRRVEVQAIESLLKRKGITISDVLSTNAPHVSNLIYKTPDMSPKPMSKMLDPGTAANNGLLQVDAGRAVPRCLTIPDVFRLTELLCADVREYVLSSFGTGAWLPQSLDSDRSSEESLKSVMDSYRTHHNILFARRENKPGVAVKEIREGLANLKKFTVWRNFDILPLTIQVIATVLMRRPRPTATMLSKQLCFIAASLDFGEGHPIVYLQKIFTRIGRIAYNDETPDYLLAIIRSSIDSHEHVLGQYHLQTLRNTAALSRTMCILYGTDGLFEPLEALRSSLESQQGPDTRESRFLRNELFMLGELHDLGS